LGEDGRRGIRDETQNHWLLVCEGASISGRKKVVRLKGVSWNQNCKSGRR
jgi:hypothetical protein